MIDDLDSIVTDPDIVDIDFNQEDKTYGKIN